MIKKTVKLKKPDYHSCKHSNLLVELLNFSIAHACGMSQFEILITSRDSPLTTQTLIFVVFIDDTTSMPELTNRLVENIPCTNKTQKIILLITHVYFLKYIFVDNFHASPRSWQPITGNCNKKIWGVEWPRADILGQGLSAGKKSSPCLVCDSLLCRN